ncbi:uncharacterized protein ColSpa_09894 [Colletotrichum spaethianum]|uniref:Uncharacterized protein n=1 Tax=Colletotrichum spaethianum TaxID=700344 RepID=A0AA37USD0_9PEZI|nr:uncharacterized protein ColSpa_09894 [Colletotrichum spaethianum]GKT49713.1 hypothetical protein ColSpa_09894 [Colletotrichum spaethianum]
MHLSALSLLVLFLTPGLALPTAKDVKSFTSASDPSVQDVGRQRGRIGIDSVDPSALRVDPVRVLEKIAQSSSHIPSLTKRSGVLLEEEDGRVARRTQTQVEPADEDTHVLRPSPQVMPPPNARRRQARSE